MKKRLQISVKLCPLVINGLGDNKQDSTIIERALENYEKRVCLEISWAAPSDCYRHYKESTLLDYQYFTKWLNEIAEKEIITSTEETTIFKYSFDILSLLNKNTTIQSLRRKFLTTKYKREIASKQKPLLTKCREYAQTAFYILGLSDYSWVDQVVKEVASEVVSLSGAREYFGERFGTYLLEKYDNSQGLDSKFFDFWNSKKTPAQKLRYLYRSPFLVDDGVLEQLIKTPDWKLVMYHKIYQEWEIKEFNYNLRRAEDELKFIKTAGPEIKNAIRKNFGSTGWIDRKVVLDKLEVIYKTLGINKTPHLRDVTCSLDCKIFKTGIVVE